MKVELVWQPYNLKSDYTRDCICQRGPNFVASDDRQRQDSVIATVEPLTFQDTRFRDGLMRSTDA
jgi:hypothetical protein